MCWYTSKQTSQYYQNINFSRHDIFEKFNNSHSSIYYLYLPVIFFTELRCRKLYPVPYMNLNCTGTRRGSQCAFSCDENAQINGTRTTFCLRKDDESYSVWNMDRQPFCEGWWFFSFFFLSFGHYVVCSSSIYVI